jgi:hypothetical protein
MCKRIRKQEAIQAAMAMVTVLSNRVASKVTRTVQIDMS